MSEKTEINELIETEQDLIDEEMENSDDSDSSDSSISDSEDEKIDDEMTENAEMLDSKEYQTQFQLLENSILENPFQYQFYIDIIKLTKDNIDFDKLREFRQKMSQVFPLTEKLWLDWLRDEQKLITNDTDRELVTELFEKSLKDYLSVEIWLEYIQFSIGEMGKPNGLEKIRSVCERSLKIAGLDVRKGNLVWEAYREFESAILSGLQASSAGSIQTDVQKSQLNSQIDRIVDIFKRQLSTCLDNTKETYSEFGQFDENLIDEIIKKTYKTTLLKYQEVLPFEMALKNLQSDEAKKLIEYKNYLDFELKYLRHKNPLANTHNNKSKQGKNIESNDANEGELNYYRLRIQCLFERAISDNSNCLDASLWLKYIYFMNEEENYVNTSEWNDLYLKVSERSVRNCPWSAKLWINCAFNLEKTEFLNNSKIDSKSDKIKGVFNQALNSGLQTNEDYLQVWHSYLDFLKRGLENDNPIDENKIEEIRDAFQKAVDQLFDFFKHKGDPTYSLEKYWSLIEAKYFKNMEKSRKIYNEMILAKTDAARYSQIWLEFYDLEKDYGDKKHQRKLLNRALNEVNMDEKDIIYETFFKFEKLNGNVIQHSNIYFRYEQFKEISLLIAARKQNKAQKKEQTSQLTVQKPTFTPQIKSSENGVKPPRDGLDYQSKKPYIDNKSTQNSLKRKKSESSEDSNIENNQAKKLPANPKDKDGFSIPSLPFAQSQQGNDILSEKLPSKIEKKSEPTQSVEQYKQFSDHTVFISNLSYEIDESKLRAVFEKEPGFKDIRIIKKWDGKSKGYGYLDFENKEHAEKALKLDRTLIDGRPCFISENKDKTQEIVPGSALKYATNLEKNKLFISGLPFTMEKKQLEDILTKFGEIKEIRIVTYKNGKSKGLAYAEFIDELSAKTALLKTDGMLIGENNISVAISNPPKRKDQGSFEPRDQGPNQKARSLGSGSYKTAANTSGVQSSTNSTFSFVPRSQVIGRKKTLSFK